MQVIQKYWMYSLLLSLIVLIFWDEKAIGGAGEKVNIQLSGQWQAI